MLNKKTKQILIELDKNSRQSNSSIAKKIGMKKETVNYIIKKLEKENIIKGYFLLINYFKLGLNLFKLMIRYEHISKKGETKISNWLLKKKDVIWIGKTEGKWDLIITMSNNNIEKIYQLLEEFNSLFSKNIKEKELLISYELNWFNEKYLYEDIKDNYRIKLNQYEVKEKIDEIDKKLIKIMEFNARIPLITIASKLKLTAQAIAKRIKNLEKRKIIAGYKIRINHESMGDGYHHLFISLKDFSKINDIIKYYENSKNCVFIMKYHGSYDLHIELITNSQNDFRKIITEFREMFGNIVNDYHQLTILDEFKLS